MSKFTELKFSRRSALKAGVALAAAGVAGRGMAQQKIAQNLVQYQETPKDGKQCDQCVQWTAPNACKIVEGKINPKGWCAAFAPKA